MFQFHACALTLMEARGITVGVCVGLGIAFGASDESVFIGFDSDVELEREFIFHEKIDGFGDQNI